jgi:hypothetical protein
MIFILIPYFGAVAPAAFSRAKIIIVDFEFTTFKTRFFFWAALFFTTAKVIITKA